MAQQFNDDQFYQYPPFNPIIPAPVWGKDAEYAVPVVSSVGNGPKGSTFTYDDLNEDQKKDIVQRAVELGAKGNKGDKGDKGDTFTFDDMTAAQKAELIQEIVDSFIASGFSLQESSYKTVTVFENTIEIPFNNFADNDILFVDIEGLQLTNGVDYTISEGSIILDVPITHPDTRVNFKALHIAIVVPEEDEDE